jgi:glycosyltransferase involved in cell wall biosynthesis
MKLLHVIPGMDPAQGGVAQAVRTMIAGLVAQGVDSEVASLDAPGEPWGQADPFTTHALGPGKGPWGYSAQLIPWLLANFSRFDAVVLHGLWLYHGYAVHKALRRYAAQPQIGASGKKACPQFFVMPHGMLDPYFQRATGRKLKAWRNWAYWKAIEGTVVNDATGVLFTCETERLLAHEPFAPYQPKREIVVGLGVEEPPAYLPEMQEAFLAKCPELQNRPYLLFLSRIHEKKGVELLLQAYVDTALTPDTTVSSSQPVLPSQKSALQEQRTKPVLVIAGPGLDTPYGQRMQQLAAELTASTAATILFPGMLTGAAKWGAFYGCEAFVLPSHQENFGIAVVEALACSKPVLISNQVNIWREIEAAAGGLVAADTLEGTQHLLSSWHKLPASEKQAFAERAQLCYRTCFAIEPAAEKMAGIFT